MVDHEARSQCAAMREAQNAVEGTFQGDCFIQQLVRLQDVGFVAVFEGERAREPVVAVVRAFIVAGDSRARI